MKNGIRTLFVAFATLIPWLKGFGYPSLARGGDTALLQGKLDFGANVRLRYEYQHNFNAKYYRDDPEGEELSDGFLLGRLRFGFDYDVDKAIHLALWAQHSEVWDAASEER